MRKQLAVPMMMAMVLCLAAAAFAADDSAVGTWKLNVQKSQFGKMPAPKSATLKIFVDTPQMLKWSYTMVGADGKAVTESYAGAPDGKQHPVTGSPQTKSGAFTRKGDAVEVAWVMKDGS